MGDSKAKHIRSSRNKDIDIKSNHGCRHYIIEPESYSSYYKFIKCVIFEPIYYTINLNVVSSSIIFSEFDYMFLSNVMLF